MLTSLTVDEPHPFDEVVELARDDLTGPGDDPTAHGALHWAPHHDDGLRTRMAQLARWVAEAQPTAVVVDVSVEVATLLRLLGVPVIVMAMPGARVDAPHSLAYRLADHILATWPRDLLEPNWLNPHAHKTSYVGGITRFDGRSANSGERAEVPTVLVLHGTGGSTVSLDDVAACAATTPSHRWRTLGVPGGPWTADPWPAICAADVVITHAGQSCVADVAAAAKPAIVIAADRPFAEQAATAAALRHAELAVVLRHWPEPAAWPSLIAAAQRLDATRWTRWQSAGAAQRAATVIGEVDRRHRRPGAA